MTSTDPLTNPNLADLTAFLDASPSPFHAVGSAVERLAAAGFRQLSLTEDWSEQGALGVAPNGFVVNGASVVAFRTAVESSATPRPFQLVGAHTDSPCLRVKPNPDVSAFGWRQLAVEVYGGALLNSWLDRDLGIAGRVALRDGSSADLVVNEAVCRVPQLAIHLDRDVTDRGLILDKQQHLAPVWGSGAGQLGAFRDWVALQIDVESDGIAGWELSLFDITTAAVLGGDRSLLASGRLDNQLSCWAAVSALCRSESSESHHSVVALFDHEEVGSESATGAAGPMLEHVLERISLATGGTRSTHLAALAGSSCISADNAHAIHPNYPERHDPGHRPMVNRGPAVKLNSNQRYATNSATARAFQTHCEAANVPWQVFVSRNNMPCGSTIGPITATRLGIATVDVGVPQLSMHSARELCGVDDPLWLEAAAESWFSCRAP